MNKLQLMTNEDSDTVKLNFMIMKSLPQIGLHVHVANWAWKKSI
jgi:hypothetical protein